MSGDDEFCPRVRLNLWLETDEGMLFGLGRAQLLEKIEELGSLNKASKALGMSYRAAWGRIKNTEEVLGDSLVLKTRGRGGCSLTPLGERVLEEYRQWAKEVENFAVMTARKSFPWKISSFDEDVERKKEESSE
ncbi:winged helix-turn-helix domain-containing protein [Maridesulfovibrio ferrireducens]|uniref:Molybdate transport system regulatory protein n=1 Tax=Maridesulfovibrio ferrireducens TaxID=246191 RepID=A0A1G9HKI2_9BACT|nr:LysR family transcriptional regulator [Maridesulfovibrio ferrireducens]MBI9110461.1 LysR family transcriptional regulator [Maridesulfovibrio ferrireducens]SDL13480.1 molybdate transport system regulatory protein [Maridesulfovibrio ferrireducens]